MNNKVIFISTDLKVDVIITRNNDRDCLEKA
jgi:hypothetical protein